MTVSMEKPMETARPKSRFSRMVQVNVTSHTSWMGASVQASLSRCNLVHTQLNRAEWMLKGDLVIPDQLCWTLAALAHLWTAWTFLLNSPTLLLIEQPVEDTHTHTKRKHVFWSSRDPILQNSGQGSGRIRMERWKVLPWVELQTEDPISKRWPTQWWMKPLLQAEMRSLRLTWGVFEAIVPIRLWVLAWVLPPVLSWTRLRDKEEVTE